MLGYVSVWDQARRGTDLAGTRIELLYGAIFEVKALDFAIGSICGGGRYDDLTGIFGMPTCRAWAFVRRRPDLRRNDGAGALPEEVNFSTRVFSPTSGRRAGRGARVARELRDAGVAAETAPTAAR